MSHAAQQNKKCLSLDSFFLDILFEDEDLLFLNKPAGLVVHPGAGHEGITLVDLLLNHDPGFSLRFPVANERPGIVHRLDKGTTGVMVVAKTPRAQKDLGDLFFHHRLKRRYRALVMGRPLPLVGTMEGQMGRDHSSRQKMKVIRGRSAQEGQGRWSKTHFKKLPLSSPKAPFQFLELELETGRTHQIRAHLRDLLRCRILNDHSYGHPSLDRRELPPHMGKILETYEYPFLHAYSLEFQHPYEDRLLQFQVAPPAPFMTLLEMAMNL